MKRSINAPAIAFGLLLCGVIAAPAFAAEGGLDTTFGSGGKAVVSFKANTNDIARAVAIQKDGRIVTAGYAEGITSTATGLDFALARHNKDGSIDTTFGTGGKVTTDFSDGNGISSDTAYAVAIQPDGKIIAAGYSNGAQDIAVARYNTDGSLDTTFAKGGKFTSLSINSPTYYFSGGAATAVALQADGKIVVAGYIYNSPQHISANRYDFVVMRFNTNGSLDSTFASGGVQVTAMGDINNFDYAYAVAIQSDGKIVVGGSSGLYGGTTENFALARYNTNGSLDSTFGNEGKASADIGGNNDRAYALAIQSDGKILAAGNATVSTYNASLALARFNSNGTLDSAFGAGGKVTTNVGTSNPSFAYGVAVQSDGRIVIAGIKETYYMVVARYGSNGILDNTFGNGGLVTTTSYDYAHAIAIQPDGKIIAAGSTLGTSADFAVYRYLGTAIVPTATSRAECLFAWAEVTYPSYFSPASAASTRALDYYYRYYAGTNAYLAWASRDNNLYYFGPLSQNTLMNLGSMSQWLVTSGCN